MANSNSIQDVRDRIIQLAREIEQFSQSNIPTETFFQEFLKRVVGAVGARAGAVWLRNGSNQLSLICDQDLRQTGFHDSPEAATRNQKLLADVMSNGQACTYSPDDANVELPTGDLIVLAALQRDKECVGAVEIFQRADTPAQARPGFLQFVEQMCGYACRYLDRQSTATEVSSTPSKLSDEFEQFLLQLHRSLDVKEVATTAANDGRLLLECDRLSVAVQQGTKTVINAISGQDSVNHRANLVRLMAAMSSKVFVTGEPLVYSGKVDHLPEQLEEPLADYVQESGSRMVMVIPLFKTEPQTHAPTESNGQQAAERKQKPIGGLIVEQVSESQPKSGLPEKVKLLSQHVETALSNARTHHRLFLMPVWRFLGDSFGWLEGRNLWKTIGCVVLVALLIAAMILVPYEYRVEGEGRLMPVTQRDVFAPWDGNVEEIFVTSKMHVKQGQPLLKLKNEALNEQLLTAREELGLEQEQLFALQAELGAASRTPEREDEIRLHGKIVESKIKIAGAREQVLVLEDRVGKLTVCAPIDGVVATFQIEQLLQNRPVQRGEVLLEIKDETGAWRLELEVEEQRIGHIRRAQEDADNQQLPVEFVLATAAEKTFKGHLIEMSTRVDSSETAGSILQIYVATDAEKLPDRHIGAEVRAKINCGDKPLGYVLFGDVVEFVQKHFWL